MGPQQSTSQWSELLPFAQLCRAAVAFAWLYLSLVAFAVWLAGTPLGAGPAADGLLRTVDDFGLQLVGVVLGLTAAVAVLSRLLATVAPTSPPPEQRG
jgi:hypothetical protein